MKIAHVLSSLNAGGIEKWLCDYTKYNHSQADPDKLYYLINSSPEKLDFFEEEIIQSGGIIKHLCSTKKIFKYLIQLFILFRREKFDVVHSHSFHFSGIVLFVAYLAGVKVRVAHSHNATKEFNQSKLRKIYTKSMGFLISKFSTLKIAVSKVAGLALFKNESFQVIPCGLNRVLDRNKLSLLAIPGLNGKTIISHVGSFSDVKNHDFIFKIAKYMTEKLIVNNFIFLFIGVGDLRNRIESKFIEEKIPSIFLDLRRDINEIHNKYTNIFLFPSHYEGLGLASIEAQAQGVPCIHSQNIPSSIKGTKVTVLNTNCENSVKNWVEEIIKLSKLEKKEELENSDFIDHFMIPRNYSLIRKAYRENHEK